MPGPNSAASCYLIEHDGIRIVLDLGPGSAGALQRYATLETIDAILLSHLHADHCLDACSVVVWHRYAARSHGPVALYGPVGTMQRLGAAYEQPAADLGDVFDFHPMSSITSTGVEIGGLRISFARMNHPVETYAIRVEAGTTSLTYSADTGICPELIRLAKGTDVLLCEAAQPDDEPGYPPDLHLTGGQAGAHAAAAGVGRLLLTHIPPWVNADAQLAAARTAFAAAELATAGMTYTL
ncbi:MAG: MBL fold metallo-hydrolase [Actinomycetota bacterium]|nr:MBL fold metallo-hydrolase [Actinomycetota bacterium]